MAHEIANVPTKQSKELNIVICGGGIIGVCTAYFLSQKPNISSITIIERHKIAGCASGKAGGFLALDWCDGGWIEALARKSFALHYELGKEHGHKYLYKQTVAYSVNSEYSKHTMKRKSHINDLKWIDCKVTNSRAIGSKQTNAQIHPRMFCETLVELMKDKLIIKYGVITRTVFDKADSNKVIAVEYVPNENEHKSNQDNDMYQGTKKCTQILCDAVVIALGPWSRMAFNWFPECKQLQYITGTKANSIVIQPTYRYDGNKGNDMEMKDTVNDDDDGEVEAFDGALFLNHTDKDGTLLDIEVYPRPDGSIYSCCHSNNVPLPDDPSDIMHEESDCQMIFDGLRDLSRKYTLNAKLMIKQACYLPAAGDSIPLIGRITGCKNAFIGTGHTCWGILNGPATGLVLAELIADGKISCVKQKDFQRWSPSRD